MVPRELRDVERRPPSPLILVGAGGSFGSLARHAAVSSFGDVTSTVLVLNVVGSLLLGALTAWACRAAIVPATAARWTSLLGLGFCGGLTTFSAHVLDVAVAFDDGAWSRGLGSLAATAVLAIAAAAAGHALFTRGAGDSPGGSHR